MMSPAASLLYVEDHPYTRNVISVFLETKGYEVRAVSEAQEALALARSRRFDLYILDNWLPDMSGIDLCRAIREFDRDTPVLFFTALVHKGREALAAGAQVYMIKPANPADLAKAIALLLEESRRKTAEAKPDPTAGGASDS